MAPLRYDVFYSYYRGDAIGVLLNWIRSGLRKPNIKTFADSDVSRYTATYQSILKGIRTSRIAIVILTKGYVSSPVCLDELVNIVEASETTGLIFLPILYDIHPAQVEKHCDEIKNIYRLLPEKKIESWKNALARVVAGAIWSIHSDTPKGVSTQLAAQVAEAVVAHINDILIDGKGDVAEEEATGSEEKASDPFEEAEDETLAEDEESQKLSSKMETVQAKGKHPSLSDMLSDFRFVSDKTPRRRTHRALPPPPPSPLPLASDDIEEGENNEAFVGPTWYEGRQEQEILASMDTVPPQKLKGGDSLSAGEGEHFYKENIAVREDISKDKESGGENLSHAAEDNPRDDQHFAREGIRRRKPTRHNEENIIGLGKDDMAEGVRPRRESMQPDIEDSRDNETFDSPALDGEGQKQEYLSTIVNMPPHQQRIERDSLSAECMGNGEREDDEGDRKEGGNWRSFYHNVKTKAKWVLRWDMVPIFHFGLEMLSAAFSLSYSIKPHPWLALCAMLASFSNNLICIVCFLYQKLTRRPGAVLELPEVISSTLEFLFSMVAYICAREKKQNVLNISPTPLVFSFFMMIRWSNNHHGDFSNCNKQVQGVPEIVCQLCDVPGHTAKTCQKHKQNAGNSSWSNHLNGPRRSIVLDDSHHPSSSVNNLSVHCPLHASGEIVPADDSGTVHGGDMHSQTDDERYAPKMSPFNAASSAQPVAVAIG